MKKLSNKSIPKFWKFFSLAILLPPISYYLHVSRVIDSSRPSDQDFNQALEIFLEQLNETWSLGDVIGETQQGVCADIPTSAHFEEVTKCNSDYLKCFLQKKLKSSEKVFKPEHFEFEWQDKKLYEDKRGVIRLVFQEKKTKNKFTVELENNCNTVELKSGIYSSGPSDVQDHIWDNYLYEIHVDKFYTTNKAIRKWKGILGHNSDDLKASVDLSLEERRNYCHSQGKLLLQSHVFDAFSYYPVKFVHGEYQYKYRYPWGREKISTEINKDWCERIYTKECLNEFEFNNFSHIGVSWGGIFHTIGSLPEVFYNVFLSRANLKLSSLELSRESYWHNNGVRSYWDGGENFNKGISFIDEYSGKKYDLNPVRGIAFRCMQLK